MKNKYFRFGEFRLYPTEHLLLREQTPLSLAPKAFDILLYLLQNSGHLVKRDALMEAIWPDSFVEETNITVNISLLRKTLGSMSDGQPYIETVPRKGYRFNAGVIECEDADEVIVGEPHPGSQKSNEDVMLGQSPHRPGPVLAAVPLRCFKLQTRQSHPRLLLPLL